jgi:MtN3 and saliva related transmembrane protein
VDTVLKETNAVRNLHSWISRGLAHLAFLSAAGRKSDTARLNIRPIAQMLVTLSTGLCLWVLYGLLKEDWVIMLANIVGATLALIVLGLKVRDSYV